MSQVYVDPICNHGWRLGPNSHMFVDVGTDLQVLHDFASRIGMKRSWFQHEPGKLPHYDVVKSRRDRAIALGAIELDRRDAVEIFRKWKGLPSRPAISKPRKEE